MFRSLLVRCTSAGLLAISIGGCSVLAEQVVLDGTVAQVDGDRVHIVATSPLKGTAGLPVTIYQRVEQKAVEPTSPPWHLLKPVATGTVVAVDRQGAWVRIDSGAIEPWGETELRRKQP